MFKVLRIRLTLLYTLAAMALAVVLGGAAYFLLSSYFQNTTDLALKYRMSQELQGLGIDLPADLQQAVREWRAGRSNLVPGTLEENNHEDDSEDHHEDGDEESHSGDAYEGELASIFVFPLNGRGDLLFDPNQSPAPMQPDRASAAAAVQNGSDLRTVTLPSGTPVRVFSYALSGSGFEVLQLGRPVGDQARVLSQFLANLAVLGAFAMLFIGGGAWWMAGRSIRPAQHAWDQQRAFIANASHELRAPLTLIRASAEMANRQLSPTRQSEEDRPAALQRQRELLHDVLQECDYMNKLVEDLLLLSRLDNQRLVMQIEPVDLDDLFERLNRQVTPMAEKEGIRFRCDPAGLSAAADPLRLKQVVLILIDNAIRSTPPGGEVRLEACRKGEHTWIMVSDTGVGIPPEHLPHVFNRFYRVDQTPGERTSGSGLGLSIARGLVEAQHGKIRLDSHPGQGTTVIVELPGRLS